MIPIIFLLETLSISNHMIHEKTIISGKYGEIHIDSSKISLQSGAHQAQRNNHIPSANNILKWVWT